MYWLSLKIKISSKQGHSKNSCFGTKNCATKLDGIIDTDYNVKMLPKSIRNVIRNVGYKDCVTRKNLLSIK